MTGPSTSLDLELSLARAFQALVRGLLYPSESDYPYKTFAAPLPRERVLDAESFRDAARVGRRYEIVVGPASQFFESHTDPIDGDNGEVPKYVLLQKLMNATLSDLAFIRVGGEDVVRVRVYVLGRLHGANLAGLSSVSIET